MAIWTIRERTGRTTGKETTERGTLTTRTGQESPRRPRIVRLSARPRSTAALLDPNPMESLSLFLNPSSVPHTLFCPRKMCPGRPLFPIRWGRSREMPVSRIGHCCISDVCRFDGRRLFLRKLVLETVPCIFGRNW